jgi:hypothetical protein
VEERNAPEQGSCKSGEEWEIPIQGAKRRKAVEDVWRAQGERSLKKTSVVVDGEDTTLTVVGATGALLNNGGTVSTCVLESSL